MNRRTFLKSLAALPLVPLAPAATAEVVRRHTYKVTTANPCLAHSPPRYRVMVYAWGRFVHEYDFVARWEGLNVLQIPHPATKIQAVARGRARSACTIWRFTAGLSLWSASTYPKAVCSIWWSTGANRKRRTRAQS